MPDPNNPMPMGPPTPGGGYNWSACQGILCPPGAQSVTVIATDCDTHQSLGVVGPFVVSDSKAMTTSINGFVVICCAVPGYSITVSNQGYDPRTYQLTADDVKNQRANVCLHKKKPVDTSTNHSCPLGSLLRSGDFGPSAAALAPFYQVRDVLSSTPRGRRLVELYYDPEMKERIERALQESAELRTEGLSLVLEILPVIMRAQRPSLLGVGRSVCGCSTSKTGESDEQPLLTQDTRRRGDRFLDILERETGASELTAMTRELAKVSDGGLGAIVRWLTDDKGQGLPHSRAEAGHRRRREK